VLAGAWQEVVERLGGGDHSFKPRVRSGRTERQNMDQAIESVAGFVKGR